MKNSPLSRSRLPRFAALPVVLLSLLVGCSDGTDSNATAQPFAELLEQGIGRYLGLYSPMLEESQGAVRNHVFGTGDGPLCADGSAYSMATRDQGSEELMIFLEGGGACWSEVCLYVSALTPGIPQLGLLDPQRENNPVRDWSQVYIPTCDGSFHAGDVDVDTDGDGDIDRFQRGLRNLSAALDVAANTFPAPSRILLAGESAGGFGTVFALPLVRHLYPGVPIDVIDDSGVGVLRPGQPELPRLIIEEWNIGAFFPASCPECIAADGHFSDYYNWQLDQDPDVRRGLLSYTRDINLADLFLKIGGPAFETALRSEMRQQEEAHPERTRSWIAAGAGHTFVLQEPDKTAGGVALMDWIGAMLDGSAAWVSASD